MATTANMLLVLPTVSVTLGPEWATDIVTAFQRLDNHNHTESLGARIPSAALSVDDDITFNNYSLSALRTIRFENKASFLGDPLDLRCLYVKDGDLYYQTATTGVRVQLTSGAIIPGIGSAVASVFPVQETATDLTGLFALNGTERIPAVTGDPLVEIVVDATSGARQIELPLTSSLTTGRYYIITRKAGTSAISVIRNASGGDLINGSTSFSLLGGVSSVIVRKISSGNWIANVWEPHNMMNGAVFPTAPLALDAKKVLHVNGSGEYSYRAIDLSGTNTAITAGVVPIVNLPDASQATKGIVRLSGDISGSAASPLVITVTGIGTSPTNTMALDALFYDMTVEGQYPVDCSTISTTVNRNLRIQPKASTHSAMTITGDGSPGNPWVVQNKNGYDLILRGGAPAALGLNEGRAVFGTAKRAHLQAHNMRVTDGNPPSGRYVLAMFAGENAAFYGADVVGTDFLLIKSTTAPPSGELSGSTYLGARVFARALPNPGVNALAIMDSGGNEYVFGAQYGSLAPPTTGVATSFNYGPISKWLPIRYNGLEYRIPMYQVTA